MSGNTRSPNISRSSLTYQEKLLLEKNDAIVLTGGKTAFGDPFYVYIKVVSGSLEQMQQDHKDNKIINFYDYGEVLIFGPGHEPPVDVKERIAKEYKLKKVGF